MIDEFYNGLSDEEIAEQMTKIQSLFNDYLKTSILIRDDVIWSDELLSSIVIRIDQRKHYYKYFHSQYLDGDIDLRNISQIKEIALLCYWLVKYKPFTISNPDKARCYYADWGCGVNEVFAAYIFITFAYKHAKGHISKSYYKSEPFKEELIYSFAERDISKEAMILLLAAVVRQN